MAVIRVNKTADYTVISNTHFREKGMSLKAKGLLSLMLSLPDNWDYSIAGLVALSKDGKDSVMNTLTELEQFGYLKRTRVTNEKGQFQGYNYDIYEKPQQEEPYAENPNSENPPQLNTKGLNTKELSIKKIYIDENFEKLWKMLPSTPYDRKNKVSKKRRKELYNMGFERASKAIEVYLVVQNPKYYHKRDNFFNEIIDNFIDKTEADFNNIRSGQSKQQQKNEYDDFMAQLVAMRE